MAEDNNIFSQQLSSNDFALLKDFIEDSCGIKLSENKRSMVEGRLRKRIRALNLSGYKEYIDSVLKNGCDSAEQMHLIDVITTNKTDFFREPNHFTLMTEKILPYLSSNFNLGTQETLNVWSSASSTGEEPYTLAMVLAEYFGLGGNFNVFATDINTNVLQIAKKAVYTEEKSIDIPYEYKKKYMLRSKNRADKLVRFIPEIRSKTRFGRNNLKDAKYILPTQVDIAFCRNVIIYFDAKTQEEIIQKICSYIKPGGFLFMGHSESVHGMKLPIRNYAPTVYIKE
ncbi:MAG: chemotaxis protein CheR [Denitrovibrio sp.]|nr:MAG: chemotaxis protein CheR [Denitrovibrio sp.]